MGGEFGDVLEDDEGLQWWGRAMVANPKRAISKDALQMPGPHTNGGFVKSTEPSLFCCPHVLECEVICQACGARSSPILELCAKPRPSPRLYAPMVGGMPCVVPDVKAQLVCFRWHGRHSLPDRRHKSGELLGSCR